MTLTPQMDTALQADAPLMFIAVELDFPGLTIRLVDGAGTVTFSGKTFTAPDPTYGALGPIDPISDGTDGQAPHIKITLLPPTVSAAGQLAASAAQGSPVSVWFGAIDRTTGAVIASPDLMFAGFLDVATLKVSTNARSVELDVASEWELFFDQDDGLGLNDVSHQAIWPGELGCAYVSEITVQLPWGFATPASAATISAVSAVAHAFSR